MPKESKKFINPLLRPSQQEVEPKQERPPEKTASTTAVQTNKTQPPHQVMEQEERSKPTPPDPPSQEASEPDPTIVPTNGSSIRPRTAKAAKHATAPEQHEQQTANAQENDALVREQDNNHVQTYEPQAETLRAHANQTLVRPETPPYNAHSSMSTTTQNAPTSTAAMIESSIAEPEERIQEILGADTDVDENDDTGYEVDFTNITSKARRKRGEQAFEKTHVRFTVWVDKNLRQSFEDLAIQRDKPKTTLLNEAIADLVRKYEPH